MKREAYRQEFNSIAIARGIDDPAYYDALLNIADQVLGEEHFTIGIGGAQGSGKSTVAELLGNVLTNVYELSPGILSIDDFYKTKQERLDMARQIHPLYSVRGVPGTHDMKLMNAVMEQLKAGEKTEHPCFNKAEDDRYPDWKTIEPTDVLILEGWCWGAIAQSDDALASPVNDLERDNDADGVWRNKVNEALKTDEYQNAFNNDCRVFLAVPDMEAVYRWRLQQEQGLKTGSSIMNEAKIREFIMYYERITRSMLEHCPENADFTVRLNEAHHIESLQFRDPPSP